MKTLKDTKAETENQNLDKIENEKFRRSNKSLRLQDMEEREFQVLKRKQKQWITQSKKMLNPKTIQEI